MPRPAADPVADRQDALDACDVLNDFVGDFITSVMVFREYHGLTQRGKLTLQMMVPIQKMCLSNILLSLYKLEEFWKRYGRLVPELNVEAGKGVVREINRRKVADFRNHYAGHLFHRDTQRPLTTNQIGAAFGLIAPTGAEDFFKWINDPEAGNPYPSTVVSVCEVLRDALIAKFQITPEEVMSRA